MEDERFNVWVGLRQGCVMLPWLFNVFMDGVMKEVRERVGDVGATLWDARRNCEWKVEWLMFADDTVLVGDSKEKLEKPAIGGASQHNSMPVPSPGKLVRVGDRKGIRL